MDCKLGDYVRERGVGICNILWYISKPLQPPTFPHTNPLNFSKIQNTIKFYIKCHRPLLPFLVFTKSKVLNVRMGTHQIHLLE